jgi:hypothetical protein
LCRELRIENAARNPERRARFIATMQREYGKNKAEGNDVCSDSSENIDVRNIAM